MMFNLINLETFSDQNQLENNSDKEIPKKKTKIKLQ